MTQPFVFGLARRLALLALALFTLLALAPAARAQDGFDHASTGFPLLGAHEQVRCETCHLKGIFKGTPKNCDGCHIAGNPRGALPKPNNHIQTAQPCDACHQLSSFSGALFSHATVAPGSCATCHNGIRAQGKPANHFPTTASCDLCHRTSAFAPVTSFDHSLLAGDLTSCASCHDGHFATGRPANHVPSATPTACATCHMASVQGGFKSFAGGQMDHTGLATGCASCHGPGVGAGTFAGITRIVVMPPTSPAGAGAHIPSSTTCESCHLASLPAGLVDANAATLPPGSRFATPLPSTAQIHTGVAGNCAGCHEAGSTWMGMGAYPIAPATLTNGAQYTGFHTRPHAGGDPTAIDDAAHPASGDCGQCHAGTDFFSGAAKPANHIPTAAGAGCSACHTSSDYSVMPTLAAIHANAPSTTTNCTQCHGSAAASFAIPAANFSIVGLPANHLPTSASCESCHVGTGSSIASLPVPNGARFAGSLMSHTGITGNCVACHGPSVTGSSFAGVARIVTMPPTSPMGAGAHLPTSTTCESCHLASTPANPVPATATATAPGTLFATPAPTTAQIHTGISAGCTACHEAGMAWMNAGTYPISPSVLTAGAQYTGFQMRPLAAGGAFSVADAAHPATGDCVQCHAGTTSFSALPKPANHIPTATGAACTACHTSSDFSVMPSLANIHANAPSTTGNCAQCHGSAAASFAIPAANFSVVGLPANHLPTSASCETCHVGAGSSIPALPVPDGARFSGSLMSHTGITGNCAACHGPAVTGSSFVGVGRIVTMPPTSPVGANSHIPSSTTCETCHLATTPAAPVPATATRTAPGTLFASPAPGTAQIHTGVTANCASCHDSNAVWMGVSSYPIAPSVLTAGAQYTGFQTRPLATGGPYTVADAAHPASGDCSQCHSGTSFFSAQDKPANHIPTATNAPCTACHTSTDYSVMPTLAAIHANAPSTTTNCAQCHGSAAASFAIPAANFSIVGLPANHLPTSASCETCHVGAGSSVPTLPVPNGARFSGSLMSHTGITGNCVACHGPTITGSSFAGVPAIVTMPPTSPMGASAHIPSSTTCETCHLASTPAAPVAAAATRSAPGTLFATPAPGTAAIHTGVSGNCASCHDSNAVWMGVSNYPIAPSVLTAGAQYTGFQTRPLAAAGPYTVADAVHPTSGDCSQCHSGTSYFSAQAKPANHIPTSATAACNTCHTSSDYSVMPTLAAIHANAPSTTTNCAQCHGSAAASFAIPAANFSIVGLPANHLPTSASCEACHVGAGSSVPTLPVPNGARFSGSLMSHTGITSNCAACHGPTITGSSFAGVTRIVVMPATSPVGASSHIPSSTTCETCHLATTPASPIAAVATRSAPGTLFATPAPGTGAIHTGITASCSSCHDSNAVWMGVSNYPISPKVLTAGALYTGFQTRPLATAGTYSVADAAHPASGDCSQCHSGTTSFSGAAKPTGHIPTTQTCTTCHATPGDYSVAGLASTTALHTGITGGCITCHGPAGGGGSGPFAGCATQAGCASPPPITYQPKVPPLAAGGSPTAPNAATHIPTVGIECSLCHSTTVFTGFNTVPGATGMRGSTPDHTAVSGQTCESCHEYLYTWYGVKITTPGSSSHHGRTPGQDCTACHGHNYSSFSDSARVRPMLRAALVGPRLMVPGPATVMPGAAAGVFGHVGVLPGQCRTCHDGVKATGRPLARHPSTRLSCDACHRTTSWLPAQFSHQGVQPGQCQTCHNGLQAPGKPGNHFVTARACDSCHRTVGWLPVNYNHLSPLYQAPPGYASCDSCHITHGELIPRQLRAAPRPRPVPVP